MSTDDTEAFISAEILRMAEKFAALTCPRCGHLGMVIGDAENRPLDAAAPAAVTFHARCPRCAWQRGDTVSLEDADSER